MAKRENLGNKPVYKGSRAINTVIYGKPNYTHFYFIVSVPYCPWLEGKQEPSGLRYRKLP